jgi:hypothetical protein
VSPAVKAVLDPSAVAAIFTGRKGSSILAGVFALLWLYEYDVLRFYALVRLVEGYAKWLCLAFLGGSVVSSAVKAGKEAK